MINGKIEIIKGDITQLKVDAIVNAANRTLLGGGGVDGAIHRKAGTELLEACRSLNGCETGEAKITKGFNLPSKYVIHTVGPIWGGGMSGEPELLAQCYKNVLTLATNYSLETIVFPNISTGIYGYPKDEAAEIAKFEVEKYLSKNSLPTKVIFAIFDEENYTIYKELFGL